MTRGSMDVLSSQPSLDADIIPLTGIGAGSRPDPAQMRHSVEGLRKDGTTFASDGASDGVVSALVR